jgi:hypothetical protein
MKNILLGMTMMAISTATFAQQPPPPPPQPPMEQGPGHGRFGKRGEMDPNKEKMEMFKIDFFTKKLSLTTAEAELFWPVYEAHKKAAKEAMDSKSNDEIQLQEALLAARKKYKADLKPVLKSDERVNEALKVDREFLQEIRHEMMRRKGFRA